MLYDFITGITGTKLQKTKIMKQTNDLNTKSLMRITRYFMGITCYVRASSRSHVLPAGVQIPFQTAQMPENRVDKTKRILIFTATGCAVNYGTGTYMDNPVEFFDRHHLYELYTIADPGVMPSLHEQCSYVAIEMMTHGISLIAGNSTGLNEMMEESVSGLHVPVAEHPDKVDMDTALLAEKMLCLLQNDEERKQMSINARKRYETLSMFGIIGRNMENPYQSF
jgi:glycosyltransferase involved in cell wall biosynthesis